MRTSPGPSVTPLSLNWSGRLSPDAGTVRVPRSSSPSRENPVRGWTRTSITSPGPTSRPNPCPVAAWVVMYTRSQATDSTRTRSGNSASSDRSVGPGLSAADRRVAASGGRLRRAPRRQRLGAPRAGVGGGWRSRVRLGASGRLGLGGHRRLRARAAGVDVTRDATVLRDDRDRRSEDCRQASVHDHGGRSPAERQALLDGRAGRRRAEQVANLRDRQQVPVLVVAAVDDHVRRIAPDEAVVRLDGRCVRPDQDKGRGGKLIESHRATPPPRGPPAGCTARTGRHSTTRQLSRPAVSVDGRTCSA